MSSTDPVLDPAIQALAQESFGPWSHCQTFVWNHLTDFTAWSQWLSGVRTVNRIDQGAPGRGSRLQIDRAFGSEQWTISYWLPQARLDFEIQGRHGRTGMSLVLEPGNDGETVRLTLGIEFGHDSSSRWLSYFSRRQQRRQAIKFMQDFSAFVKKQHQ